MKVYKFEKSRQSEPLSQGNNAKYQRAQLQGERRFVGQVFFRGWLMSGRCCQGRQWKQIQYQCLRGIQTDACTDGLWRDRVHVQADMQLSLCHRSAEIFQGICSYAARFCVQYSVLSKLFIILYPSVDRLLHASQSQCLLIVAPPSTCFIILRIRLRQAVDVEARR